jgi:thiol:disulfide interchange protein
MNAIALLLPVVALFQPAGAKFTARLHAAHESIQPGGQTELAIEINVQKGWHIYHPLVLDTGAPTTVSFAVPPSVTLGELRFPTPMLGKEYDFEYLALAGQAVVLTTLQLAPDAALEPLEIKATVRALACKELCIPVEAQARLTLKVSPQPPSPADAEFFKTARAAIPAPLAKAKYIEGSGVVVTRDTIGIEQAAEVLLTVSVRKGHHIQDRDPGNKDLIASRLFIEPLDGLKFAEQQWPEPHMRELPGFGKVREQSGTFKVRVPLSIIDREFASGPIALRVLFTYQACNDAGACYPPEWAEGVVRLVADTPNPAVPETARGTLFPATGAGPGGPMALTEPAGPTGESPSAFPAGPESESDLVPRLMPEDWAERIPWQKWQPGLAEELARRGHEVYVDYTATWCLTCQTNKAVVLETDEVRAKMRALHVIPILADFTNRNPAMQQEINRWAPTVPVNVVYAPGHPKKPAVLPTVLTQREVFRALEDPLSYTPPVELNLWLALLGGFLGGLILNVMPCVLPVISIKILSFVQQGGEDPKRVLRLGLAFCGGIMVWFWAFAWLSTRGQIPWQYPEVVITLGSILFVFSLNLFGVFEVMLPGAAASKLDALAAREGYTGAFLKGLLATLLGTACTAPFIAGAFTYARTQPAWVVFLVFSAAGVGMAAPYLLLSAKPAWLRFIPKPGPWMVTFKQAAAFVLLGTVVWLLWILADQIDGRGVVWTVAFWGFLGLAVWMYGKAKPTWEPSRRAAMVVASIGVALLGFWFCYRVMYDWHARTAAPAASAFTSPIRADAAAHERSGGL